jgi:hypothetical protein
MGVVDAVAVGVQDAVALVVGAMLVSLFQSWCACS